MSLGCMAKVLGTWFGLPITKGGITQLIDRVRDWTKGSYEVVKHVRGSGVLALDETGRAVARPTQTRAFGGG